MNIQLAWLTGASFLAWLLVLQLAVWATRPADVQPAGESLDLGPEPPAVANLLAGGWRMTPDATSATLIDLAARDILGFEQFGPDPERTVCRVRQAAPTGLTRYEKRVFERVTSLAEGGVVPAAALVRGNESWATSWWRQFRKEAIADARHRGLTRDRWNKPTLTLLRVTALAPALLVAATIASSTMENKQGVREHPVVLGLGAAFAVWSLLVALIQRFTDQRDTEAGRAAAARWLGYREHVARDESFAGLPPAAVAIWDRHLAYAAALGIAKTAVRVLPLGARSEKLAWSAYGGAWHQIRVRYPSPRTRGRNPWRVGLRGLIQGAIGVAGLRFLLPLRDGLADDLDTLRAGLGAWAWTVNILLALAALLLLRGVLNVLRALIEYPSRRPVEGEVVRLVARASGDSEHRTYTYYAGVDDGRSAKTRAYVLTSAQYRRLDEGDEVRLVAGRYLGRVFELAVTKEEEKAPPPTETVSPPSPAGALAGGVLGGGVAGMLAGSGVLGGVLGALSGASGPMTEMDPAALVTEQDVAAALGVPVTMHPVGPQGGTGFLNVRMCSYTPQGSDHPTLLVHLASNGLAARLTDTVRNQGEPLADVPDAYYYGNTRQQTVVVLHGRTTLTIGSYGPNAERSVLHALAAAAATRMATLPVTT